jgi:gamma-glutamyl-gamma-aminobutyrate hydrolase PuuD
MEKPKLLVNSMHHQGIKTLAAELVPAAVAPDGLVEAIERDGDHFMVGVQWHPEMFEMTDPHTRHLFSAFIAASRKHRGGH